MSNLFAKGNFQPINNSFLAESLDALQKISDVQEKYAKGDNRYLYE